MPNSSGFSRNLKTSARSTPTGCREICALWSSIWTLARAPPTIMRGADSAFTRSFREPFAASSCSMKPASQAFARQQSTHSLDPSTKMHSVAPRLRASMPTEPVPEKRSSTRTDRSSKRCIEVNWLKSASRTFSIMGLMYTGGCSKRLLLAMPVVTRNLEGYFQLLCANGAPCANRHSTFCLDRFDRPFAWCEPPLTFAVRFCLWISMKWLGTSVFTISSGPGSRTSSCELVLLGTERSSSGWVSSLKPSASGCSARRALPARWQRERPRTTIRVATAAAEAVLAPHTLQSVLALRLSSRATAGLAVQDAGVNKVARETG
mmetsp:Transcript_4495/g.10589  ORF Transcript_4495/g.10589 Transcript_4495/m.10589 type:complete len:320 (-) Transcript_4495:125-1084(-)